MSTMSTVAERVCLGDVGAIASAPFAAQIVLTHPITFEVGKDIGERLLADLAHALRRQLIAAARLADVASLFQHARDLAQLFELLALLLAEQVPNLVVVER